MFKKGEELVVPLFQATTQIPPQTDQHHCMSELELPCRSLTANTVPAVREQPAPATELTRS